VVEGQSEATSLELKGIGVGMSIMHHMIIKQPSSTKLTIYLLRKLMGMYRDRKIDLHMVFIDLEKAYDRVPREVLWRCLEKKGVLPWNIRVIKDMYT